MPQLYILKLQLLTELIKIGQPGFCRPVSGKLGLPSAPVAFAFRATIALSSEARSPICQRSAEHWATHEDRASDRLMRGQIKG